MNDEASELHDGDRDAPTAAAHKAPRPVRPDGRPDGRPHKQDPLNDMLPRPFQVGARLRV